MTVVRVSLRRIEVALKVGGEGVLGEGEGEKEEKEKVAFGGDV